jgi:hypothetical protein
MTPPPPPPAKPMPLFVKVLFAFGILSFVASIAVGFYVGRKVAAQRRQAQIDARPPMSGGTGGGRF